LLGEGEKLIEIVDGEEKDILYWADWSRTQIYCTYTDKPNEPTKEGSLYICTL
jgi:hypothetical protein